MPKLLQLQTLRVGPIRSHEQALKITQRLSRPSKMPCLCYNLPAKLCKTGSIIKQVPNTTCGGCYARVGWYPARYKDLYRRYKALSKKNWVYAMAFMIRFKRQTHFRWHDSGDLQSLDHLHKIVQVCKLTPDTKHWLPTLEWGLIRKYWELHGKIPMRQLVPNLKIILSSIFLDKNPPMELAAKLGVGCSAVSSGVYTCPAMDQGHKCLDCRKCWDQDQTLIIYKYQKTQGEQRIGKNFKAEGYQRKSYVGLPPNSPVLPYWKNKQKSSNTH